jgi:hypothetical protein
MIITIQRAKRMMADDGAFVRRFYPDGTELASATEWTPDATWSTANLDGVSHVILDNPATQATHHVAI